MRQSKKTEKELENGLFEMMDTLPSVETLVEENKEMSEQTKRDYKVSSNQLWIEKFMKYFYHSIFIILNPCVKDINHC